MKTFLALMMGAILLTSITGYANTVASAEDATQEVTGDNPINLDDGTKNPSLLSTLTSWFHKGVEGLKSLFGKSSTQSNCAEVTKKFPNQEDFVMANEQTGSSKDAIKKTLSECYP